MNMILVIASHDLYRMYKSALAWVIMALVQFLSALMFYAVLSRYMGVDALQDTSQLSQMGVTNAVVIEVLRFDAVILLLIAPLLTMRLISEEYHLGTFKLIMSSPVSITQLVLGKYLGISIFYFGLVALVSLLPLSLLWGTELDLAWVCLGLVGLFLSVASFSAIGLFISSMTASSAIAGTGTFGVLFLLWIVGLAGNSGAGVMSEVFYYLSLLKHYQSLLSGAFNSADVLYHVLLGICFILLTIWHLNAKRMHG